MIVSNIDQLPDLGDLIREGYITARHHPLFPLTIFNYTAKTQYEGVWNPTTLTCRGLICNDNGDVVARPFAKFFNLEQVDRLPDEPFEVYEKMDGSLGILYWWNDQPYIATRGSFDSEQARAACSLFRADPLIRENLDRDYTYLFEIIYPENRIVVDYGDRRDLVLLAKIHTQTGREDSIFDQGWSTPNRFDGVTDIASLRNYDLRNYEGFVIRFQSGLRVKVKLEEYVRLHKLLTGITEKTILEDYLIPGNDLAPLLERVPDEFNAWLQNVLIGFRAQYAEIEMAAAGIFNTTQVSSRKEYAEAFSKTPYPAILFKMLDGKDYSNLIWKMLRPQTKSFMTAEIG